MHESSLIRTYTLHDVSVDQPDGSRLMLGRPLTVTVGSQALEPDVKNGKTLIRFEAGPSMMLNGKPQMKVKVRVRGETVDMGDATAVEIVFENNSFISSVKEMPFWLVESLEFAAARLREQYRINQEGGLDIETLES